jgi:hypothetical protein
MEDTLSLGELLNLLTGYMRDTTYPPGRRVQLSLACYYIVRDHHHAIAVLTDEELYASAFALVRPLYEAAVKGMWIQYCALPGNLEKYAGGKELPKLGELIDDLSKSELPNTTTIQLVKVKKKYWQSMSSLTHAGHAQVTRWLSPEGVMPTYTEATVQEIVDFTAYMAVVVAVERARLGSNENAISSISKHLPL